MNRRGYTLVEMMIATALSLMMMVGVVEVFGRIGEGIRNARAGLEMTEEQRQAANLLRADLEGATATMRPPCEPGSNRGYLEATEGPNVASANTDDPSLPDTTLGDVDDMLMLTVRSKGEPFRGRCRGMPQDTVESYEAEVAWFVRGRTLYRRVLLVAPHVPPAVLQNIVTNSPPFYANCDVSVRINPLTGTLAANTLGDLTMPENRFAHQVWHYRVPNPYDPTDQRDWKESYLVRYPSHPHLYINGLSGAWFATPWASPPWGGNGLGLPTLAECTSRKVQWWIPGAPIWPAPRNPNGPPPSPAPPVAGFTASGVFDAWRNPYPWNEVSPSIGSILAYHDPDDPPGQHAWRVGEDVILNNVLSFDVKVWDPGAPILLIVATGEIVMPGDGGYLFWLPQAFSAAVQVVGYGAYVDLGYPYVPPPGVAIPVSPSFNAASSNANVPFSNNGKLLSFYVGVYDTWSTHYEEGGLGRDGFDNDGKEGVDNFGEWSFPPPYSAPLRGIQVKIRVFEPDSRQVREVTVVQEFVAK